MKAHNRKDAPADVVEAVEDMGLGCRQLSAMLYVLADFADTSAGTVLSDALGGCARFAESLSLTLDCIAT